MKRIVIALITGLHICIFAFLVKIGFLQQSAVSLGITLPSETTRHYQEMVKCHTRLDGSIPDNATLFIGASIMQGLHVPAVTENGVNLGIGNDTTAGVIQRLRIYKSITKARAVVLNVGFNDLRRRTDDAILRNYAKIISTITPSCPVIVTALFPIDTARRPHATNRRIAALNQAIQQLCSATPQCTFLDISGGLVDAHGNLRPRFHTGDGVHLSTNGYTKWIEALQMALQRLSDPGRPENPQAKATL